MNLMFVGMLPGLVMNLNCLNKSLQVDLKLMENSNFILCL